MMNIYLIKFADVDYAVPAGGFDEAYRKFQAFKSEELEPEMVDDEPDSIEIINVEFIDK
jgi:hypothetical protein